MSQAQALFFKAVDLMGENKLAEAEAVLQQAQAIDPNDTDIYEALARLYDRSDNDQLGLAVCQQWIEKDANSNMAYSNLSVFHQKLNHIDEAEDAKAMATTLFMRQTMAAAKAQRGQG